MATMQIRRLRLGAAFVLLTYLILHFSNHALGLYSLDAMEAGRRWFLMIWRSPLGTLALYGAIVVHGGLGLWLLYQRRTLRMPGWEAAQYALGLALPALLASHVVGTRVAWWHTGSDDRYARLLLFFWVQAPECGAWQAVALAAAWTHACIGVHYWLRFRPWYPRVAGALFTVALLLPTLALAGFVAGGREVAALARTPGWTEALMRATHPPGAAEAAALGRIRSGFLDAYLVALGAVLAARGVRTLWQRRRSIRILYPAGRVVTVPVGFSVLEASRMAGIPHASVCGGRGRCSTCRIRVDGPQEALLPPAPEEVKVLRRVGAAPDVRLACQLRPHGDLRLTPLLPASAQASDGFRRPGYLHGAEREIAILFADLRSFTQLSEKKLPYDLVFLLNRYFAETGHAVEAAGGRIDKFIGDGVMALFGLDTGVEAGCREALAAARDMSERMETLNRALIHDISEPLRIGIGIHTGPAIVGEMGYGSAVSITAVGDSVNTASRVEGLTKTYACELVISDAVALRAGIDLGAAPRHEIEIRGRVERLVVRAFASARDLPVLQRGTAKRAARAAAE